MCVYVVHIVIMIVFVWLVLQVNNTHVIVLIVLRIQVYKCNFVHVSIHLKCKHDIVYDCTT